MDERGSEWCFKGTAGGSLMVREGFCLDCGGGDKKLLMCGQFVQESSAFYNKIEQDKTT